MYGYIHVPSFNKAGAPDDVTPLVHRVAALLKRWWLGTHQGAISPNHLAYYLDEFTFRFNRRKSRSRGKLFYRLVQKAVAVVPMHYNAIVRSAEADAFWKHNPLRVPERNSYPSTQNLSDPAVMAYSVSCPL